MLYRGFCAETDQVYSVQYTCSWLVHGLFRYLGCSCLLRQTLPNLQLALLIIDFRYKNRPPPQEFWQYRVHGVTQDSRALAAGVATRSSQEHIGMYIYIFDLNNIGILTVN